MAKPSQRYDVLQVLRAIAAGLVVLVHAFDTYIEKVGPIEDLNLHYGFGGFGVKLFFCISGYIIYRSSAGLEPGWASASFFARRRLIRIVPLYWCATLIYATKLSLQGNIPSAVDYARSLLFIPYTNSNNLMRPILGQGWTLNYEILFYVTLCLSLMLRRELRFPSVALFFVLAATLRLIGFTETIFSPGDTAWALMADPLLLFFLSGMFIGIASKRIGRLRWMPSTWTAGMAVMLLMVFSFLVAASLSGLSFIGGQDSTATLLVELAVCSLLVFVCVQPYVSSQGRLNQRLLPVLAVAGDGSYSTYLIHGFVLGPTARIFSMLHWSPSPWIFSLTMVVVCSIVGILVFRFFERPLQLYMNNRWGHINPSRLVIS